MGGEEAKRKARPGVSLVLQGGEIAEMVYRPEEQSTSFAVWDGKGVREEEWLELPSGARIVPYSPENNLLVHDVVLFPSEATEYASEGRLASEVRSFIHRYVDVSQDFQELASHYVLFTWLYDAFGALPYLRVRGDYGSGKSRFLLTIGSLCYKPIFASGASTVSPIFRILDAFQGTLVIDEGDFRVSDERAEIVKILNNGNARGFPVLRSEETGKKEFSPRAFHVFGPKVIATRRFFDDRALESRCITEELGTRRLRNDVPLNLPTTFADEARELRNKLLLFRFRNVQRIRDLEAHVDRTLEPRISQVFAPLLATATDEQAREHLRALARRYSDDLQVDRGLSVEAQVLEAMRSLLEEGEDVLSVKGIAERLADRYGQDYEKRITPRWVGGVLRRRLFLKPVKRNGAFVLPPSELPKLERLFERYGTRDVGDIGDIEEGEPPLPPVSGQAL